MRGPTVLCLTCQKRRSVALMASAITCQRCIEALVQLNRAS